MKDWDIYENLSFACVFRMMNVSKMREYVDMLHVLMDSGVSKSSSGSEMESCQPSQAGT